MARWRKLFPGRRGAALPLLALPLLAFWGPLSAGAEEAKPGAQAALPKDRMTATGKRLDGTALVRTLQVEKAAAVEKALADQPGVLEVEQGLRVRPPAEYVVVYFDGERVGAEELLKRVRESVAAKAEWVRGEPVEGQGVRVTALNPVALPGDVIQFEVEFTAGAGGKAHCAPPVSWVPLPQARRAAGKVLVDVQAPGTGRPGVHRIPFKVQPKDGGEQRLEVSVELIPQAGRR